MIESPFQPFHVDLDLASSMCSKLRIQKASLGGSGFDIIKQHVALAFVYGFNSVSPKLESTNVCDLESLACQLKSHLLEMSLILQLRFRAGGRGSSLGDEKK